MRPAVFVDRDGTLLEEAGYLDRLERLLFFPFSIDAVRLLNRANLAVVVVTNQSGIARGMYAETFVHETHAVMKARMEEGGARVDGFYYCPHHPDATVPVFKRDCDCRKPAPGMLMQAARDLDSDLARSYSIGDKWTDVAVGSAAGGRGILVRTGYGRSTEASMPDGVKPAAVEDNLIAAVAWTGYAAAFSGDDSDGMPVWLFTLFFGGALACGLALTAGVVVGLWWRARRDDHGSAVPL